MPALPGTTGRSRLLALFEQRQRGVFGFVLQEPALAREAAGVAGERAVGADDAVAGDDDADRVQVIGEADGPGAIWVADVFRLLAIGARFACRDAAECGPGTLLIGRAVGFYG